jgi:hypothetical protein
VLWLAHTHHLFDQAFVVMSEAPGGTYGSSEERGVLMTTKGTDFTGICGPQTQIGKCWVGAGELARCWSEDVTVTEQVVLRPAVPADRRRTGTIRWPASQQSLQASHAAMPGGIGDPDDAFTSLTSVASSRATAKSKVSLHLISPQRGAAENLHHSSA